MKVSERSLSSRRAGAASDPQRSAAPSPAPAQAAREQRENEAARPIDAQAKQERIAVAAYYLAERRGFAPGCELDDWLRAEAEVEAGLQSPGAHE